MTDLGQNAENGAPMVNHSGDLYTGLGPLGHRVFFGNCDYHMYVGECVSRMRAMRQGSVGVVFCVVVL